MAHCLWVAGLRGNLAQSRVHIDTLDDGKLKQLTDVCVQSVVPVNTSAHSHPGSRPSGKYGCTSRWSCNACGTWGLSRQDFWGIENILCN